MIHCHQFLHITSYLSNSVEDTKVEMNCIFSPNPSNWAVSSEHARRCIVLRLRAWVSAGNFPNARSPLIVDPPTSTRCVTCHQVAQNHLPPGASLATRWLKINCHQVAKLLDHTAPGESHRTRFCPPGGVYQVVSTKELILAHGSQRLTNKAWYMFNEFVPIRIYQSGLPG